MADANERKTNANQPYTVGKTKNTGNGGQGEQQEKRQAIADRKNVVNQKTIERQQHDIRIEGLVLQLELANHQNQESKLDRCAQELTYLQPIMEELTEPLTNVRPFYRDHRHNGDHQRAETERG